MFSTGFAFLRSEGNIPPVANLLLDDYPNAEAGISFRKLRTDYSGSCIRVRRSSDNTEQDIGFVSNYIDTATLTSFCSGTNGFIKIWYDQSENGNNVSQTSTSLQPQIVTSGTVNTYSGKVCANYDGTTFLATSSQIYNLEAYSLHKFDTTFSQGVPIGFGLTDANANTYAFGLLDGNCYLIQNTSVNYSYKIGADASFWAHSIYYGTFANMQIWKNNTNIPLDGSAGPAPAPLGELLSGKRGIGGGIVGIIQEQIVYNYTTANTDVTNNINDYYSVY
jgi:hypothetical protein